MFKKFVAVGIAVKDVKEAVRLYTKVFGIPPAPIKKWPQYGVNSARLPLGDVLFDLMEPYDPKSAVAKGLATRGEGVFLVTVEVDSIKEAVRQLKAKGVQIVAERFIHPSSARGVLIELVDKQMHEEGIEQ